MPRRVRLRVRRWGDELAILIPRPIAAEQGLLAGDVVDALLVKERGPAEAGLTARGEDERWTGGDETLPG
ncbi:MAG TPA: hypothetical protein VI997_10395 [Candidatus Thermoplasmatota archaeon]|nr:hypothetical protein [Candidatus Thermoplasmatota archaeon]